MIIGAMSVVGDTIHEHGSAEQGSGPAGVDMSRGAADNVSEISEPMGVEQGQNVLFQRLVDMQAQMTKMLEKIESLEKDKKELHEMLMSMKEERMDAPGESNKRATEDAEVSEITTMNGYDSKNIQRPSQWSGDREDFVMWRTMFEV